jgi:phage gpG-like protein
LIEIKVIPEGSDNWTPASWEKFYSQYKQNVNSIPTVLAKNLNRGMILIAQKAKTKYLTGGNPLNVQTGRLRASVLTFTKQEGPIITSKVGTDVFYGRIHEYGGTFQAKGHKLYASTRRIFKKYVNKAGKTVKKTVGEVDVLPQKEMTKAYTITFKRRPWLTPAVEDEYPSLHARLEKLGFQIFQLNKKDA